MWRPSVGGVNVSKRHKAAHEIWHVGASNPVGVANALVVVMREARDEDIDPGNDAAVKMILDHLCFLCCLDQPSIRMGERWDYIQNYVAEKAT